MSMWAFKHLSVYGEGKRRGAATMFLCVGIIITINFTVHTGYDMLSSQAFLNIARETNTTQATVVCGATAYCNFTNCRDSVSIGSGENVTLSARDCTWTAAVLTRTGLTRREALAISTDDYIFFPELEQELLRFVTITKRVDKTEYPERVLYTVTDWDRYMPFEPCTTATPAYDDRDSHTCGAFEIHFDRRTYIDTPRSDLIAILTILVTFMLCMVHYFVLRLLLGLSDLTRRISKRLSIADNADQGVFRHTK